MSCWQLSTSLSEERYEEVTAWRQIQLIPHWWKGCVSEVLTGMLDVLPCLPRIERVSITCDMSSHLCTPMYLDTIFCIKFARYLVRSILLLNAFTPDAL